MSKIRSLVKVDGIERREIESEHRSKKLNYYKSICLPTLVSNLYLLLSTLLAIIP